MFIFEYGNDWATLVNAQLAARHQTLDPRHWSYACLCIGEKFDTILSEHYLEIDKILGPYLHVFSLFPPPLDFVARRYQDLRTQADSASMCAAEYYKSLLERPNNPSRETILAKKASLLNALRSEGVPADHRTDFLFFAFRSDGDDINIDIVAVGMAPLAQDAKLEAILDLFASMAKKAEKHYKANDSVKTFVHDLSILWAFQISFRKAQNIFYEIKSVFSMLGSK